MRPAKPQIGMSPLDPVSTLYDYARVVYTVDLFTCWKPR